MTRAIILSEASGTLKNEKGRAIDCYSGSFSPVRAFVHNLSEYCQTTTHIITGNKGVLKGDQELSTAPQLTKEKALEDAKELLINEVRESDIIIILLTSSTFEKVVSRNWNEIMDNIRDNCILCLGSGRSVLEQCDISTIESSTRQIHIYERVGVAPIDSVTMDEVIESIKNLN